MSSARSDFDSEDPSPPPFLQILHTKGEENLGSLGIHRLGHGLAKLDVVPWERELWQDLKKGEIRRRIWRGAVWVACSTILPSILIHPSYISKYINTHADISFFQFSTYTYKRN